MKISDYLPPAPSGTLSVGLDAKIISYGHARVLKSREKSRDQQVFVPGFWIKIATLTNARIVTDRQTRDRRALAAGVAQFVNEQAPRRYDEIRDEERRRRNGR